MSVNEEEYVVAAVTEDPPQEECDDKQEREDEEEALYAKVFYWNQAEFLLEQGKLLYHSWTSTDAGLPEFQGAWEMLNSWEDAPGTAGSSHDDLYGQILLWTGHAHAKLKHYELAAAQYEAAVAMVESTSRNYYTTEAQEAYLAMAKVHGDAGQHVPEYYAALQAARMGWYLTGRPSRPSLHALQRADPEDFASTRSHLRETIALEWRGERLLQAGDAMKASEVLEHAAQLEEANGRDNIILPMLYRKAALALAWDGSIRWDQVQLQDCNETQHALYPRYCELRGQAESMFVDQHRRSDSTYVYYQAIRAFERREPVVASHELNEVSMSWMFFLMILLLPSLLRALFSRQGAATTTVVTEFDDWTVSAKSWTMSQWVFVRNALANFANAFRKQEPESAWTNTGSSHAQKTRLNETPLTPPLRSEHHDQQENEQDEQNLLGQEILPSQEDAPTPPSLDQAQGEDNIGSSVESLGRILAGFETEMPELPRGNVRQYSAPVTMVPIE